MELREVQAREVVDRHDPPPCSLRKDSGIHRMEHVNRPQERFHRCASSGSGKHRDEEGEQEV
jgi:hypothetical protein